MAALISTAGLGAMNKLVGLTAHTRHRHVPSPVSPYFVAPAVQKSLSFQPVALAAAIARTATTRDNVPVVLLNAQQQIALIELNMLLQRGSEFELHSHFGELADTARSQFAAKVGAGIAHLYMEALGYAWRANAVCLSSSLDPHADFVYDGGNVAGHGVVLAEAHGSFAKDISAAKVANTAKRKYTKQVKPHLAGPSPYGNVIHGYSIAFGCKPTSLGSFLAVSETRITKPRTKIVRADATESTSEVRETPAQIALATHRSNFLLLDATDVVDWIDWSRSPDVVAMPEQRQIVFARLKYAARTYLVSLASVPWMWLADHPEWWIDALDNPRWRHLAWRARHMPARRLDTDLGLFAIEEGAGTQFLKTLSLAIQLGAGGVPPSFQLPVLEPVGFDLSEGGRLAEDSVEGGYQYVQFRDGLALLGEPSRGRLLDFVAWSPLQGMMPI